MADFFRSRAHLFLLLEDSDLELKDLQRLFDLKENDIGPAPRSKEFNVMNSI